jgi:FAD/FMN-containing dehydrogenase
VTLNDQLGAVVGQTHVLDEAGLVESYTTDWTRRFGGPARLVVRPADTGQVAEVVAICARQGVPLVLQGGNAGLVGGSVPGPDSGPAGPPVILSLRRLDSIGAVDGLAAQVTAGAGATLADLQRVAAGAGLEFPVDLAARDSATVGGMVATNAGGVNVIRYGGMRAQVVGVEAVLAGGQIISRLSGLVKDNTGYDLSQLLVGSEGTLGVVTAARLRLIPHLAERAVLLVGLPTTAEALSLVAALRTSLPSMTAAEIFYREGVELVCRQTGIAPPWSPASDTYLLIECAARTSPLDELTDAMADRDLSDRATAVATDPSGIDRLWAYRERHSEAVSSIGIPHKLDVTLPLARLADFESAVRQRVEEVAPGSIAILWGHVGDGNLHVNVVGPDPDDDKVDFAVLETVTAMGGSISAEHGIGRAKRPWLALSRSPSEIDAMRAVKAALDPKGILNPGVLIP